MKLDPTPKTWTEAVQACRRWRLEAAAKRLALGVTGACPRCGGDGELPNWSTANGMRPCPACKPTLGVMEDGRG